VVLSGGVVVAAGPPSAIGGRDAEEARITFRLPDGLALADLPLPAKEGPHGVVVIPAARPTHALRQLTEWAERHQVELAGLAVERPSLEDVYLQLTNRGAEERAPERSHR
jgi:ABC-2 type transport system ATP-binding protein